ncbi:hypothetical protein [Escherichia coli]|uniref:hypothetical protein n=1 Tax=Escherichia coli TaxID=562 RepID=UPI0039C905E2
MSQPADFVKDYGPAIGPTLAFLLGVFALFIKYKVDQFTASRSLKKRLLHLQKMVISCSPPTTFHPKQSETGFIHADEARNLSNIARFYSKLLALNLAFDSVEKAVIEHGNAEQILMFHNSKWWFKIIFNDIEKMRNTDNHRLSKADLANLTHTWELLKESILGQVNMDYI